MAKIGIEKVSEEQLEENTFEIPLWSERRDAILEQGLTVEDVLDQTGIKLAVEQIGDNLVAEVPADKVIMGAVINDDTWGSLAENYVARLNDVDGQLRLSAKPGQAMRFNISFDIKTPGLKKLYVFPDQAVPSR